MLEVMMIFNQVKYKPSYYNVVFERNGEKYLCNTYSGALAHLDEDDFIYLQSTCQFDEDCAHYGLLKSNGYIK